MATLYVRSTDGSDADNGTTWALAKATLAGALAIAAAGDRIWVSHVHAETQASAMTLTSPGTAASPVEILCGNDAAEPPTALASTATVTTTGAGNQIALAGFAYIYGLTFNVATSTSTANFVFNTTTNPGGFVLESCTIKLINTGTASRILSGAASGFEPDNDVVLLNCTLVFSATGQRLLWRNRVTMLGGSVAATGTVPTSLLLLSAGNASPLRFQGVNISALASGTSLVTLAACQSIVAFEQCKLGASVALTTGTPAGPGGPRVLLDNCDSADTQYRMQRHQYGGDVYSDTAVFRTSGASDGTTPLGHKMVSSGNSKFAWPLYGPEMVIYNSVTGSSKTVTVEIVRDIAATDLTDAEVWLEVEYLGTSGFPLALFAKDRAADVLATPAAQDASSVGWTLGGFGTAGTKQKLVVTFTPQEVGIIRCRVALAKASTTIYVDPLLTVA